MIKPKTKAHTIRLASTRLKKETSHIIDLWSKQVRTASGPEERLALIDILPAFLAHLGESLCQNHDQRVQNTVLVEKHSEDVLTRSPYSLPQVLLEYRILREVIFSVLEEEGLLPLKQRDIVLNAIQRGMTETAIEFVKVRIHREQIAQQELKFANQRLQALQNITKAALSKTTHLNSLLSDLLKRVALIFRADTVFILLLSKDHKDLVVRASHGEKIEMKHPLSVAVECDIASHIFKNRKPVLISNSSQIAKLCPDSRLRKTSKLLVCVPLHAEVEKLGILQLGFLKKRQLPNQERALLQLVANRIAIAIDNAKKYEESKSNLENLQTERSLRTHFTSIIAHDVRSPLTAAQLSAQLLVKQRDRPDVVQNLATRIVGGIRQADKLIKDLLDVNHILAGESLVLTIEEFDWKNDIESLLERLILQHGDRFVFDADGPIVGFWARQELGRLVEALIDNSLQHSGPDGPILVTLENRNSSVVLAIQGQGPPLTREKALILTQQLNGQVLRTNKNVGWNLGITLARGIVESQGGKLQAECVGAKGVLFRAILPRDARPFQTSTEKN